MSDPIWWHDHRNLAALWRWMEEFSELPEDGPAYFMSKPWKWQGEWDAMQAYPEGPPVEAEEEEEEQIARVL